MGLVDVVCVCVGGAVRNVLPTWPEEVTRLREEVDVCVCFGGAVRNVLPTWPEEVTRFREDDAVAWSTEDAM